MVISQCRPDEAAELVDFRVRMQRADEPSPDVARTEWLFGRNPASVGDRFSIWIARLNGEIVGIDAGIPFCLKVGRDEILAQWGVDLVVDERFRGMGIAAELNAALREGCPVACSLGMTDAGYKHALRNGYTDMGTVPRFVHVLTPAAVLPGGSRSAAARAALVAAVAAGGWVARKVGSARSARCTLVPIDGFDERADAIWQQVAPAYPVIGRRDATTLAWRFDTSPDRDRYHK